MKNIILFCLLLIICFNGISQVNKWPVRDATTGEIMIIDFTATPSPTISSPVSGFGTGGQYDVNIMTDINSNILFTTAVDGNNQIEVWDASFQPMPNGTGLLGNSQSFESAISPVPCTNDKYYLIHCDNLGDLYYSIIDLAIGDVTSKNILLGSNYSGYMTVSNQTVSGCRWLLTAKNINTNSILIEKFLISESGIGPPSSVTIVGGVQPGEIELSPDNSRLALTYSSSVIRVWQFQLNSGTVSGQTLPFNMNMGEQILSLEFSPDSWGLFYRGTNNIGKIGFYYGPWQHTLLGVNYIIEANINSAMYGNHMESAGNGKIYLYKWDQYGDLYLSEIENPNAWSWGFVFVKEKYLLGSVLPVAPNVIDGEPPGIINHQHQVHFGIYDNSTAAENCNSFLFIDKTCFATSWVWDFGDGTTSNLQNPTHHYSLNGFYPVTLTVMSCTGQLLSATNIVNATLCCCDILTLSDGSSFPGENLFACAKKAFSLYPDCISIGTSVSGLPYSWEIISGSNTTVCSGSVLPITCTINTPGYYTLILETSYLECKYVREFLLHVSSCVPFECDDCIPSFAPVPGYTYVVSAWTKELNPTNPITYENAAIHVNVGSSVIQCQPRGKIIDGWQKIEEEFTVDNNASTITIELTSYNGDALFDDVRIFPKDGSMKAFVYDPETMRFVAELDENNYATFYEYDDEGKLIRVKKETERGVMTVQENRNNTKK